MAKTYDKVRYIETIGFNPHYNLALESALMDAAKDGELIVYLWRNDNTVVIGRHQNAYLDVNIKKLHDAGGFLARRPTGGGAVFHDKGNLNFSFITSLSDYDVNENNDIIIRAVKKLGLFAEVNGRGYAEPAWAGSAPMTRQRLKSSRRSWTGWNAPSSL